MECKLCGATPLMDYEVEQFDGLCHDCHDEEEEENDESDQSSS